MLFGIKCSEMSVWFKKISYKLLKQWNNVSESTVLPVCFGRLYPQIMPGIIRVFLTEWLLFLFQALETFLHTQKEAGSFALSTPCLGSHSSGSCWLEWAISWEPYLAKESPKWKRCLWWVFHSTELKSLLTGYS